MCWPQFFGLVLGFIFWLSIPSHASGAFGLTTNSDNYAVDTGAGLVFKVRRTDNGVSTQSAGDLMSLVYNGVEYQDQSRGSQINSGFDFLYSYTNLVSVSATVYGTNYIKITVVGGAPASGQGVLTHYYIARNGYPHIYMATSFTTEPDTLGLCRYIVRIPSNLLSNGPTPSDIRNNTGAIESSDIFGMADGTTRSKHYSNHRLMDWSYIGATGTNVGVYIVRDNHEGDSGGPFYRSLLNQCGSDQEITYIVNYGEAQTEAFRTNILNGPYALVFNGGGQPSTNIDYSWIDAAGLNLTNWVSNTNRGAVSGMVSGVPTGFQPVVGFANTNAQYWTVAATNGSYTTPLMIPGTYTATLYKQEFAVATASVVVTANTTNTLNLTSTEATPTFIWKIGEWDGTPAGMLNADKMNTMHPSDVRMSNWAPGAFVVESNNVSQFPCVQFRATNSPGTIKFNLTASQITTLTLRIGTTCAYIGARPQVSVNSYNSSFSSAPNQPSTRSITIGSYRGNNYLYTFSIPSSALVVGQNTIWINPVSGSSDSGPWLSASWPYDCIELDGPVVNVPTTPTGLTATAGNTQSVLSWNGSPAAVSYNVKRATVSGGTFTTIATGVKAPTYTDAGLVNSTPYYYIISAVNSIGESATSSSVSATPLDLFAYWKFDEASGTNAADSAGTNNGTLAATSATWIAGKTNNAVHLNGTANSFVSLPAGLVSTLSDFTIATWVKVDTNNAWARIFDFGTGTGNYMFLAPTVGSTMRYAITTASTGSEQQINNTSVLSTGGWHHIAVTLSGNTGVLYVDGAPVGTNSAMTLHPANLGSTTQNYIGKSQWPDPNLIGSVDDFRIYNRALSSAEINSLFNPPALPASPTNLTATVGAGVLQVNLNWNAASGAASYHIKRATANGGPYTLIAAGVTTTNFSDPGVTSGTTYYYVVSTLNVSGEGTNSPSASATPFDLYGYWKFDETSGTTAADVTGTHNATLAAGATWVAGKFNNAIHFNAAATSYANFPTGLVSSLNDFSITTWVKVDANATWARIFDFGKGTTNYMFLAPASGSSTVRFAITTNSSAGEQQINNAAVLSTGVWHHLAVTLSGIIGVLYIDGVPVGTNTGMTIHPSTLGNTVTNYLGKSQWSDPVFSGSVDEFRIYNRALSATEISSLAIVPATPTNLIATAGDAQVSLSWNPVAGADSYNLKRATTFGGAYTMVTNLTGSSFINTGLSNGTLYYFVISATNSAAESTNSLSVTARPVSATPTPLSLNLVSGQLQFNWSADHTGWRLQSQTNNLATGLGTNWVTVANSSNTNQMILPMNTTNGSVFFRLVYP